MREHIDDLANPREVETELRDLAGKDWQLWSIGLMILVVLATGIVTLGLPGLLWHADRVPTVQTQFLPQLVSGLILLIALLNIYLIGQKRRLDKMRDGLIRNVLMRSSGENSPIMDRLTKVFGPEYVAAALEREMARTDRNHSTLTVALFDVAGLGAINRDHGILAGDYLLLVTGQILKKTFRGADTVCRYAGDQFLVILPETSAAQAEHAFARVREAVARWNDNSDLSYDLALHLGVGTYVCGVPADTVLLTAKSSLQADKKGGTSSRLMRNKTTVIPRTGINTVTPLTSSGTPIAANHLVH